MGLFSGLLGNAGAVDVAEVEAELASLLADGEQLEQAFKLLRDMIVFTNRRLILIDKQGITQGESMSAHFLHTPIPAAITVSK
jgi:type II secretory pathway component PulF